MYSLKSMTKLEDLTVWQDRVQSSVDHVDCMSRILIESKNAE
jgi:hypothetical protein